MSLGLGNRIQATAFFFLRPSRHLEIIPGDFDDIFVVKPCEDLRLVAEIPLQVDGERELVSLIGAEINFGGEAERLELLEPVGHVIEPIHQVLRQAEAVMIAVAPIGSRLRGHPDGFAAKILVDEQFHDLCQADDDLEGILFFVFFMLQFVTVARFDASQHLVVQFGHP